MPFLVAAVALIAALCLLNLLLTFGVIRKLRAQAGEKADQVADGLIMPAGSSACEERLPLFVEQARRVTRETGRSVLAVVHGTDEEAAPQVAELSEVAHVVVEPNDGPLGEVFDIRGYPVFGLISADGTLATTTFDPARLPAPSKATV
jgi:hypothetical protein